MIDADTLAEALARITPTDAGTKDRYDAYWAAANRFAAEQVAKNIDDIRAQSERAVSANGRRNEFAVLVAKEGVRIRNEYLAKAG